MTAAYWLQLGIAFVLMRPVPTGWSRRVGLVHNESARSSMTHPDI
jgi:hypothetical protein